MAARLTEMRLEKSILAVVPARGGSKGVSLKNVHPLGGKPLIAHTGELVRRLPFLDRVVVSTDHPEIARVARESGMDVPFLRPTELSGDRIGDWDVINHALNETERIDGRTYDVVIMLQPTCPTRRPEHVVATIDRLIEGGWDAAWTLSETDLKYHPLKSLVLNGEGSMGYFDARGATIKARQELNAVYHRNGACYAVSRQCLVEQRSMKGARTVGVVLEDSMISIDTLDDFARAEVILAHTQGKGGD